jgi:hypothetical protein
MTSKPYRYSPTKADLSTNWRTKFIEPEMPTKPKKIYSLMKIEDYPPYKEALSKLPIGLFGPAPFNPSSCACGRYIVDNFCKCASSCAATPKAQWARENPEAYQAEQAQQARWKKIWYEWYYQRDAIEHMIYQRTRPHFETFERLCDEESSFGCHQCEKDGYDYCRCELCEGCGSKYCFGCPAAYDDGYDSY